MTLDKDAALAAVRSAGYVLDPSAFDDVWLVLRPTFIGTLHLLPNGKWQILVDHPDRARLLAIVWQEDL